MDVSILAVAQGGYAETSGTSASPYDQEFSSWIVGGMRGRSLTATAYLAPRLELRLASEEAGDGRGRLRYPRTKSTIFGIPARTSTGRSE